MDEQTAATQSATKESTPANSDRPQNTTSILYDHEITNDGTATKDEMARVQAIFAWDLKHNLKTDWLYIKHHFAEDRHPDIQAIHSDIISQTGTQSDQLDKDYLQGRTMNLSISNILQTRDTLNEVQHTDLMSVEIQNKTLQETVQRQEGTMQHLVEENVRLRLYVDELTQRISAQASEFPGGDI